MKQMTIIPGAKYSQDNTRGIRDFTGLHFIPCGQD